MGMGLSPPLPILLPCVLPPLRERHYLPSSSVGRSASWALVAVAFRPSASKRRVAPVWALRLPTPYGLRPVPGSRRRSDPRRLRPASHIRGSPCPCAVYRARPCHLDIALRRVATTTAISPHLGLGDISPRLGLNPAQGPLPTHHTSSRTPEYSKIGWILFCTFMSEVLDPFSYINNQTFGIFKKWDEFFIKHSHKK